MEKGKIVKERSREWELKHSLWILWSYFGFGFVSFIIISTKLKHQLWGVFALIYTAVFALGVLTVPDDSAIDVSDDFKKVVMIVYGVSWVVSIIHCHLVKSEYLIGLDKIDKEECHEEKPNIDGVNLGQNNSVRMSQADVDERIAKLREQYKR